MTTVMLVALVLSLVANVAFGLITLATRRENHHSGLIALAWRTVAMNQSHAPQSTQTQFEKERDRLEERYS